MACCGMCGGAGMNGTNPLRPKTPNWMPSNTLAMVETVLIAVLGRRPVFGLPVAGWIGGHSMISGWTGMPGTPHRLLPMENRPHLSFAVADTENNSEPLTIVPCFLRAPTGEPLVRPNSKCYNALKYHRILHLRRSLI